MLSLDKTNFVYYREKCCKKYSKFKWQKCIFGLSKNLSDFYRHIKMGIFFLKEKIWVIYSVESSPM